MWKMAGMVVWVGSITLVTEAAGPGKLPFTVGKETTVLTAPLAADGRPDYVAYINQPYAKDVTPENNGFSLWLEIVGTDKNLADSVKGQVLAITKPHAPRLPLLINYMEYLKERGIDERTVEAMDDGLVAATKKSWQRGDNADLAGFLNVYDQQLNLVTEAAARPHWYSPYVGDSAVAISLPSLGMLRAACRELCARAMLHANAKDFLLFLRDITAMRRIARHLDASPTLVEMLVADAIEKYACEAEANFIVSTPLTAEQLTALQNANAELPALLPVAPVADQHERYTMLDSALHIALDHAPKMKDYAVLDPLSHVDPASVDWDSVLKQLNEICDQRVAALKLKKMHSVYNETTVLDRRAEDLQQEMKGVSLARQLDESRDEYTNRVTNALIATHFSSLGRADDLNERAVLQAKMLTTLLAAARYKLEKGKWPEQLDDLVPLYTAAIPLDPYTRTKTDDPIHYLLTADGPCLYGVGYNGNDDGGIFNYKLKVDDIIIGVQEAQP